MYASKSLRVAALVSLTLGSVILSACTVDDAPTAVVRPASPTFSSRLPTDRSNAVRLRVAATRQRGLNDGERARLTSLKGKWQWVADVHHAAMQGAIHDPSLHGLRQPHTQAERCAIAVRYLTKYSPTIEAHSGRHYPSDADRKAAIGLLAETTGVCPATPTEASIFLPFAPAFRPLTRLGRTPNTATVDGVAAPWRDYMLGMVADIQLAKDLGDATDIMDTYLSIASVDPAVPAASLSLIAGTIDLVESSAQEWDAFARPREGSLFMWGWMSAVGDWIVGVVTGDATGCISGVEVDLGSISGSAYYGSYSDFSAVTGGFCAAGAILGSIGAAI